MLKSALIVIAAALLISGLAVTAFYSIEIHQAYERIDSRGNLIASPYGDIEYTEAGSGPDVLVIHGSGGGYDQGELVAQAVLDASFHAITPSRFGYLRSTFNAGATFDDQAHAYAYLLDHLGIEQVAVVALSHGGPSALLFAVLYPERVSSLTLISCGVVASQEEEQSAANERGTMLTTIFQHDLLYWSLTKLFRKEFMELMGANDAVIAGLTPAQLELADRIIDEMNPVAQRSAGVLFDNKAALPGPRIAAITAPTLIVHATDDTLQLFHNAEFAAAEIPDARLISFERGGHLVMAVEQAVIREAVQQHIWDHSRRPSP